MIDILPLCFAFCGNVVLTNLSLAYSSVTFYQLVRILMTPGTAILNYIFYNIKVNNQSIFAIIVICTGIAITTFSESTSQSSQKTTELVGVFFALAGVTVSSLYVIWIGTFAKKFTVSSMQLLLNQAPYSALLLMCVSPFLDSYPSNWAEVPVATWGYIALSGFFAILINISQFFIIHGTNALTSTIVGHVKTCSIVALGWIFGGPLGAMSLFGIFVAVGGIFRYSSINQMKNGTGIDAKYRICGKRTPARLMAIIIALLFVLAVGSSFGQKSYIEDDYVTSNISCLDSVRLDVGIVCMDNMQIELRRLSIPNRVIMYDSLLTNMRNPTTNQTIFLDTSAEIVKLEIVLIELSPEPSKRLKYVIKNIAHIYGGSKYALSIIYSPAQSSILHEMQIESWTNVRLTTIDYDFGIEDYNLMLMSYKFWQQFKSEFVLITHTDAIIFRAVDDEMYEFDLIGAPWTHSPMGFGRPQVGNGGHTIRKVKSMVEITTKNIPRLDFPEDCWMSARIAIERLPSICEASKFAVEVGGVCSIDQEQGPSAAHQLYKFQPFEKSGRWLMAFKKKFVD